MMPIVKFLKRRGYKTKVTTCIIIITSQNKFVVLMKTLKEKEERERERERHMCMGLKTKKETKSIS